MPWVIIKAWQGMPETAQRATRQTFPTREAAEARIREIRSLFPGRVFVPVEVKQE